MKSFILLNLFLLFVLSDFYEISAQTFPPVYVVIFTHIEDNTPAGVLGTPQSKQNYLAYRGRLIAVGNLFLNYNAQWVFEPDWKFLLAALLYEDSSVTITTNGKNLLLYMKENLNVVIDPHSHEQMGYNYTDVAHLLDSLGVGGSTVIGGHIWDPTIPQFQHWDRFRVPVPGSKYPWALWRGDILMGSGTPNHVNDPLISGVWRPKDRYHFFIDDTTGNIVCVGQFSVGQYTGDIELISELIDLYSTGIVPPQFMLTASMHIKPNTIMAVNGLNILEDSVLIPLVALRNQGKIVLTDFTSLVNDWKTLFGTRAYIYSPDSTLLVKEDENIPNEFLLTQNYPNPFNPITKISYTIKEKSLVSIKLYNLLGEEIAEIVNEEKEPGLYETELNANELKLTSGIYFYKMVAGNYSSIKKLVYLK